jgi:hypothetical protein
MIENMIRNFRALWRAESIIADLHFHRLLSRLLLKALAGLIAVFGLLMLNVSAFFAIEQYFGRVWSAASVALFDFIVAGIIVAIATRYPKSRELNLALEVRQEAIQSFELDARLLQVQFSTLADEVRTMKTSMTNLIKHPLDEALSQVIAPLAAILIRSLGKKRSSGKSAKSSSGKA